MPVKAKKEHVSNVKNCNKGSNVSNHAWLNDHQIDFHNANVIDKCDYRVRKLTLESWHTAVANEADKNSRALFVLICFTQVARLITRC